MPNVLRAWVFVSPLRSLGIRHSGYRVKKEILRLGSTTASRRIMASGDVQFVLVMITQKHICI